MELSALCQAIFRWSLKYDLTELALLVPAIFEPVGSQLGVPHRVLNVAVPEIGFKRAGVVPRVRQRISAGVPQHMRVDL
jgi:hypothetical protein